MTGRRRIGFDLNGCHRGRYLGRYLERYLEHRAIRHNFSEVFFTAVNLSTPEYDAMILGAGAAGLMCAIEAGHRGRRVLVLERAERIGKKILISGGGRCNVTNLHTSPENFLSANPHFCKSALARYTPADFIRLVEKHRIPYHEKKLGQLFCDRAASEITSMLERECCDAGVE